MPGWWRFRCRTYHDEGQQCLICMLHVTNVKSRWSWWLFAGGCREGPRLQTFKSYAVCMYWSPVVAARATNRDGENQVNVKITLCERLEAIRTSTLLLVCQLALTGQIRTRQDAAKLAPAKAVATKQLTQHVFHCPAWLPHLGLPTKSSRRCNRFVDVARDGPKTMCACRLPLDRP